MGHTAISLVSNIYAWTILGIISYIYAIACNIYLNSSDTIDNPCFNNWYISKIFFNFLIYRLDTFSDAYGTHVLTGVDTGTRILFWATAASETKATATDFVAKLCAGYKTGAASFQACAGTEKTSSSEEAKNSMKTTTWVFGGNEPGQVFGGQQISSYLSTLSAANNADAIIQLLSYAPSSTTPISYTFTDHSLYMAQVGKYYTMCMCKFNWYIRYMYDADAIWQSDDMLNPLSLPVPSHFHCLFHCLFSPIVTACSLPQYYQMNFGSTSPSYYAASVRE